MFYSCFHANKKKKNNNNNNKASFRTFEHSSRSKICIVSVFFDKQEIPKLLLLINTFFSGLDSFGNIRTSLAQENTSWPDINMNFVGVHINIDGGVFYKRGVNMKDSYHRHFSSLKFKEGFSVIPILLHPYSRGFITLKNTNPFSKPLIHAGFFSDKRDVKVLIEGKSAFKDEIFNEIS